MINFDTVLAVVNVLLVIPAALYYSIQIWKEFRNGGMKIREDTDTPDACHASLSSSNGTGGTEPASCPDPKRALGHRDEE
jgi:hypothetical protein